MTRAARMQSHKPALAAAIVGFAVSFGLLDFPASVIAGPLALLAVYIAVVDLDRSIIPDAANAALFALGLCLVLAEASSGDRLPALGDALFRAGVIGALFLILRFGHARLTGAIGLGLGDVKLAVAGAPFLSWTALPLAVALAAAAGILAVMARAFLRGEPPSRQFELPFGAFLAPAIWICFVFDRTGLFLN